MQSIADNVYIEDRYLGATLGAVQQARGLIQIDAPPSPEDLRSWRGALMGLSGGPDRLLVLLDAHPDRSLGARAMECMALAQGKTTQVFRARSTTFKAQGAETGSDWETIPGLGTVRWASPEISFTNDMTLHWDGTPVLIEHHPGPTPGATWVVLPAQKVVFVGDLVCKTQPPFLAHADLPEWLQALDLLSGDEYRGFTVVSGRGGAVSSPTIKAQVDLLKRIHERLEKMARRGTSPEATEKWVEPFLSTFKSSAARRKQYVQRMRYGLHSYYSRHYHLGTPADE